MNRELIDLLDNFLMIHLSFGKKRLALFGIIFVTKQLY